MSRLEFFLDDFYDLQTKWLIFAMFWYLCGAKSSLVTVAVDFFISANSTDAVFFESLTSVSMTCCPVSVIIM